MKKKILAYEKFTRTTFPFGHMYCKKNHAPQYVKEWLGNRVTSKGRELLSRIQETSAIRNSLDLLAITKGLSLNNCYWIGSENESFSEVNLYENSLSAEIAEMAFSPAMQKIVKFAAPSPEYSSEGAMRKCWIRRKNKLFLIKSDDWQDVHTYGQAIAEYYASQVADVFGIRHISYSLEKRLRSKNREDILCICPIFTSIDVSFIPAYSFFLYQDVCQDIYEGDLLPTWLEVPENHLPLMKKFEKDFYEDMKVFDFLIGNQDRHLFNFGYLFDSLTNAILSPAPIFDNVFSLLSDLNDIEKYSLEECIRYADRAAFLSFSDQCRFFLSKRHYTKIKAVANMEIHQHPDIRIFDATFDRIQKFVTTRAKEALRICDRLV